MDGAATSRMLTGFGGWSVNCSPESGRGLRGAGLGETLTHCCWPGTATCWTFGGLHALARGRSARGWRDLALETRLFPFSVRLPLRHEGPHQCIACTRTLSLTPTGGTLWGPTGGQALGMPLRSGGGSWVQLQDALGPAEGWS